MKVYLKRLPQLVDIYDVYKYNYAKHVFDVNAVFTPNPKDGTLDVTCLLLIIVLSITLGWNGTFRCFPVVYGNIEIETELYFKAITVRPAGNSRVVTEEIALTRLV